MKINKVIYLQSRKNLHYHFFSLPLQAIFDSNYFFESKK